MIKKEVGNEDGLFGRTVRAYRLGYAPSEKHKCFIKLETDGEHSFCTVWLVPLTMKCPGHGTMHVEWWADNEESDKCIINMIPALKGVEWPKEIITFDIDPKTGETII